MLWVALLGCGVCGSRQDFTGWGWDDVGLPHGPFAAVSAVDPYSDDEALAVGDRVWARGTRSGDLWTWTVGETGLDLVDTAHGIVLGAEGELLELQGEELVRIAGPPEPVLWLSPILGVGDSGLWRRGSRDWSLKEAPPALLVATCGAWMGDDRGRVWAEHRDGWVVEGQLPGPIQDLSCDGWALVDGRVWGEDERKHWSRVDWTDGVVDLDGIDALLADGTLCELEFGRCYPIGEIPGAPIRLGEGFALGTDGAVERAEQLRTVPVGCR